MTKEAVAHLARGLALRAANSGPPILHLEMRALAWLAGDDWGLVDGAVSDAFEEIAAERRRDDPTSWQD